MNIRISSPGLCWPLPESPDSSFATFVNAVLKVQFCSSSPRAHFCLRSVCICCWGRKSLPQIFASLTPSQSLRPSSCVSRLLGAAIPSLSPSSHPGWYSALNSTTSFYFWIYVIYQHSSLWKWKMVCLSLWKWKFHLSYCVSSSCLSLKGRLDSPVPKAQWPLIHTPWMKEKAGKQCTNIPGVF